VGGLGFFFKLLLCFRDEGRLRKKKLHVQISEKSRAILYSTVVASDGGYIAL